MFKSVVKDEITVPGHIDYLGELRNFVTKTGKKYDFSDSIVNAFKLSIDEAATNIIKHAYRDWEGSITMRIIVKTNSLTVILIDQGKYFDPAKMKDPDLKRYVDIGKKGGLGIFIMRKLIDEIDYRHTEEGNELRLTKYRDGNFRRKVGEKEQSPRALTSPLSVSLKSRYSLVSAAILTVIIIFGYSYFYLSKGKQLTIDILNKQKSNSENIARLSVEPGENTLNIVYLGTEFESSLEEIPEYNKVNRVIILDSDNLCQYSTDKELIDTIYKLPQSYETVKPGIFRYTLKKEVYDIVSPIYGINNQKIGEVHLLIEKKLVEKDVTSLRKEYLRLAMLILLLGYTGIAVLIYIVMNPFRKLSDWIRDLGHGEVKDEIDFDTRDELGEIAKAFSDITDKFRQSQVNLAEQERLQKEMQLAQDIQQTLLPTTVPNIEGYEIASFYASAKEVGGDYYDFVEVDKDSLGIVVADVSGKGVPGSLIMTMIRTVLRTEARGVKSSSEVLARLNDFVVKDMKKGMFVTIFYVIIDSKRRRLNYASAGHNPMILFRQSTNKTYYLNPKGFPVGISLPDPELFKKSIESDTIQMAEDDILLIYTDGITEAMNSKRELFGEERLLETIRKFSKLRVEPFTEKVKEEIFAFTQGFEQNDDITIVTIKEKSSPEKIELQRAQKAHSLIRNNKNIREACEEAGITTYAYYNKYKKIFEEEGLEAYEVDETISLESKHLSIEEKTRIYDIIKKHPEFGAKRISEELNTELYGFTDINESRIYDELVRSRLNTRQLREAYVARSGKKRRMKPPGTPMLTLDGRIILDTRKYEESEPPAMEIKKKEEDTKEVIHSHEVAEPVTMEDETVKPKDYDDDFYIESLISVPIEDLLEKKYEDNHKNEIGTMPEIDQYDDKDKAKSEIEYAREEKDDSYSELIHEEKEQNIFEDITTKNELVDNQIEQEEGESSFSHLFGEAQIEYSNGEATDESSESSIFSKENINMFGLDEKEDDGKEISEDGLDLEKEKSLSNTRITTIVEDIGLDHDFSFKDIWEENTETEKLKEELAENTHDDDNDHIQSDEMSFEELVNNENFPTDQIYEEQKRNSTPSKENTITNVSPIENNLKFEDVLFDADNQIREEAIEQEKDDISFDDLLEEIDNDISFYDSGIEIESEEKINQRNITAAQDESDEMNNIIKEKHLILGLKYYKENKFDKAIEEFKQVIEVYPGFKEVHSILGNAYFRNDMSDLAMVEYQQVKQIDPHDVDAYENIGVIYANRGEYSKAILEWEKLLEIDDSRIDIKKNVEKAKHILEKVSNNV